MALLRNVLQEDDILCEFYADTRSYISDCSDHESWDSDSDIPTISIPIFPHIYQDNFYNSVRLAQTLLDRKLGCNHYTF